ncbi:MAG: hypothetical protein ACJ8M1_10110 [Chthoniobacterales bacterium]
MAGDASAVAFDFFVRFDAGEAEADADPDASVAGDADSVVFALRPRFLASGEAEASAAGDAAGDSEAVASAFLCDLCLAGEADASAAGDGDSVWAVATLTPNVPIANRRTSSFGCMTRSLTRSKGRQEEEKGGDSGKEKTRIRGGTEFTGRIGEVREWHRWPADV